MHPKLRHLLPRMSDRLIHVAVARYSKGSPREKAHLASSLVEQKHNLLLAKAERDQKAREALDDLNVRIRARRSMSDLIARMRSDLDAHEARMAKPAPKPAAPKIVFVTTRKPNQRKTS